MWHVSGLYVIVLVTRIFSSFLDCFFTSGKARSIIIMVEHANVSLFKINAILTSLETKSKLGHYVNRGDGLNGMVSYNAEIHFYVPRESILSRRPSSKKLLPSMLTKCIYTLTAGRMMGNPYSSNEPGLGPLMRDVKNKICQDCELVALLEDDSGMELLVNNKIISLDLPVKEVYKKIWIGEAGNQEVGFG